MSEIVIKVENVSKQYRLGKVGTGSLGHDLNRWWHLARGKEDPYLKIGEVNDRSIKGSSEYVWALKDINFEVKQGEVLGIIGKNGAGKSTLLKILSRTTSPTTGSLKAKGRIASLLEVGTGFHPELTGRENIFMNGAILGMTKREIKNKFDEIVSFSGVEKYIDTPVKRYSSGMYVRLAFAVAAFLEPEILIVDEVLAVGDAEFQKKCLGKMKDVSVGQGRTVLFVSHNMDAVRELTNNSLLLELGQIKAVGETLGIVRHYLSSANVHFGSLIYDQANWVEYKASHLLGEIKIIKAELVDTPDCFYSEGESLNMKLTIQESGIKDFDGLSFGMRLMTLDDKPVGSWFCNPTLTILKNQTKEIDLQIRSLDVAPGKYYFTIWIGIGDYTHYNKDMYSIDKVFQIEVMPRKGTGALPVWYTESWGNAIFKNLIIK